MSDLSLDSKTIAKVPILHNNVPTRAPVDARTLKPMTRETVDRGLAHFKSETVVKPDRQLGGCYISDKAESSIGSVKLCDDCVTSYWFGRGGLRSKGTHRASWPCSRTGRNYFTSECDGCGRDGLVILFLPESQFESVLGGTHGTFASPKCSIFSRFAKSSVLNSTERTRSLI